MFNIAKMIFRSLVKKPATTSYPFKPKVYGETTRGHIQIDEKACILCGICARKCPADAIAVSREQRTWQIQRMQCIQCSSCVEVCPKKCLVNANTYTAPGGAKVIDIAKVPEAEKPA